MSAIRIWLRYFAIWPGLPAVGNPKKADVIIVQAFGRNSFIDERLFEIRRIFDKAGSDFTAVENIRKIKFLDNRVGFDSGLPNKALAQECRTLMERYNIPAIVQWEIATAFEPEWYRKYHEKIICLWPSVNPKEYFSSQLVKEQAVRKMIQMAWLVPLELAHRRMTVCSFMMTKRLLKKHRALSRGIVVVEQRVDSFDPNSVHWWTRNKYFWIMREVPVRVHHVLRGIV